MTKKEIVSQVYNINSFYASKGYTKKYSESWFAKKYDKNLLFLAFDKNESNIVGFGCLGFLEKIPNYVNLILLCVHKDYLRRGIGTRIINRIRRINFRGYKLALNVKKFNEVAISFYKQYGFEKLKEYKDTVLLIKK